MIIWIASYPKSGNTYLRSFLASYYFSKDGKFDFNLLNNIKYKNPKLLILLDNSEFLVYLLLACSKLHILNSPINASLKIDQIYKICELIKFTHIITAKKNYLTSRIKNNLNIRIIFIKIYRLAFYNSLTFRN